MIDPITAEQPSESLDAMRARHARELDEKLMEVLQSAYATGRERSPMRASDVPRIAAIHGTVAAKHGLAPSELLKRTRDYMISHPRQEAFLLSAKAGYTAREIGKYYGGLHPSTVTKGIQAYEERAAQ